MPPYIDSGYEGQASAAYSGLIRGLAGVGIGTTPPDSSDN